MTIPAAVRDPVTVDETTVAAGRRARVELHAGTLISGQPLAIPVEVLHGRHGGPSAWVSAAIHGDEILGIEVIRRVLATLDPRTLRGTLYAVPIVNVHGFNTGDRYLPDRRDLNRSFPGSRRGSFAAQLADQLLTHVVAPCELGIDLHTGSYGRSNLPQLRADLSDAHTRELCAVFGTPIAIDARLRDGSLRQVATERGKTVLLYEGGEALRFDAHAIDVGVDGVLRVLAHVGMFRGGVAPGAATVLSPRSSWVRTTRSGVVHTTRALGAAVERGDEVAVVYSARGDLLTRLRARHDGVVIGLSQHPLANRGDAICHIAQVDATPDELDAALATVPTQAPPTGQGAR